MNFIKRVTDLVEPMRKTMRMNGIDRINCRGVTLDAYVLTDIGHCCDVVGQFEGLQEELERVLVDNKLRVKRADVKISYHQLKNKMSKSGIVALKAKDYVFTNNSACDNEFLEHKDELIKKLGC
jgi:hypothetical protein